MTHTRTQKKNTGHVSPSPPPPLPASLSSTLAKKRKPPSTSAADEEEGVRKKEEGVQGDSNGSSNVDSSQVTSLSSVTGSPSKKRRLLNVAEKKRQLTAP